MAYAAGPVFQLLTPEDDDYFILKPKHSAFFSTTLDMLLEYLEVQTVFLTGVAGNIRALFNANDAYMGDFGLVVPTDCIASNTGDENQSALDEMSKVLKSDTRPSTDLDLNALGRPTTVRAHPQPSSSAASRPV